MGLICRGAVQKKARLNKAINKAVKKNEVDSQLLSHAINDKIDCTPKQDKLIV